MRNKEINHTVEIFISRPWALTRFSSSPLYRAERGHSSRNAFSTMMIRDALFHVTEKEKRERRKREKEKRERKRNEREREREKWPSGQEAIK